MAKPQVEHGYIRIANELFMALNSYRLSGEEWLILISILRKTYGYNKKQDSISLSQFVEMTSLLRPNVIRAINKLEEKNVIIKTKGKVNNYRINKDYDSWTPSIKKDTSKQVVSKKIMGSIKKDNKVVSKKIHTKDNIKDNIQKTISNKLDTGKPVSYGNNEINELIAHFLKVFQIPKLDGPVKQNRQYCYLCIRKYGDAEKVHALIDLASKDTFWSDKMTSFQKLYYNGIQILTKARKKRSYVADARTKNV